jgi:hypothetical protein
MIVAPPPVELELDPLLNEEDEELPSELLLLVKLLNVDVPNIPPVVLVTVVVVTVVVT